MARVSVAMCTFNGEAFLQEQLESILAQTRLPDELVICDDCSTDGTRALLNAFQKRAGFPVSIHSNPHQKGTNKNFEHAISLCSGDIIFLADQDDVWRGDKVEKVVRAFAELGPPVGLVLTDGEVIDSRGTSRGYSLWKSFRFKPREQGLVRRDRAIDVLTKHNVVTGATVAFRAEYKSLITPFPSVGVHDSWISLLVASVTRLHAIHEPLIKYRHHSHNQVGAAARTVGHALQRARSTGASAVYTDQSEQSAMAAARLEMWEQSPRVEHAVRRLKGRADFTNFRARLPSSRFQRLLKILPRLLGGEYSRFAASGLRSAAADLVHPR